MRWSDQEVWDVAEDPTRFKLWHVPVHSTAVEHQIGLGTQLASNYPVGDGDEGERFEQEMCQHEVLPPNGPGVQQQARLQASPPPSAHATTLPSRAPAGPMIKFIFNAFGEERNFLDGPFCLIFGPS